MNNDDKVKILLSKLYSVPSINIDDMNKQALTFHSTEEEIKYYKKKIVEEENKRKIMHNQR